MTASERVRKAWRDCEHVTGLMRPMCRDCIEAALLAHAEAMREECVKVADGESCDQTEFICDAVLRIVDAIRALKVE
jgi:hypothetical protein